MKATEMKVEQGSGICSKGARERKSLRSTPLARGLCRMFPSLVMWIHK